MYHKNVGLELTFKTMNFNVKSFVLAPGIKCFILELKMLVIVQKYGCQIILKIIQAISHLCRHENSNFRINTSW